MSGDANSSEMGEEADNDASAEATSHPVTLTAVLQSLDIERYYLEAAGCKSYKCPCCRPSYT